jgi:signal transduction histidine kinase
VVAMVSLAIIFRKASDRYEYFLSSAKRLMDIAITPIAVINANGRIIQSNLAMSTMTGLPAEALLNTQLSSYFEDSRKAEELINDVFHNKSGTNIPLIANVINKKINILCTASVYEESGKEKQGLFFLKDVTDLVSAENKTKDYASNLEKQNKELDQFAYIVSHDLKAPLRAIANLSEWIKEDLGDTLPDDSKKNFDLLQNRVNRMTALIAGILEYSRVGRIKVEQEKVDTNQLLADIVDTLFLPEKIKIDIQPNMPILNTEKILLQQVFSNLLSNAIKFNNKPIGEINVSCKELDAFYEFTVMDNGPGIAPEHQKKVFDIFQTLEAKDKVESTGIGLSIVKKIIDEHGGEIEIESSKGEWTKFIFNWPK